MPITGLKIHSFIVLGVCDNVVVVLTHCAVLGDLMRWHVKDLPITGQVINLPEDDIPW